MKLKIKETGEIKTLTLIDPLTGCDWAQELLEDNFAGLTYDNVTGMYLIDKEEFDWWEPRIRSYQIEDNNYYASQRG